MKVINTPQKVELNQEEWNDLLVHLVEEGEFFEDDMKLFNEIHAGIAIYDIPKGDIHLTGTEETISFTTHPVNQTAKYLLDKYGENGQQILMLLFSSTKKERLEMIDFSKDAPAFKHFDWGIYG